MREGEPAEGHHHVGRIAQMLDLLGREKSSEDDLLALALCVLCEQGDSALSNVQLHFPAEIMSVVAPGAVARVDDPTQGQQQLQGCVAAQTVELPAGHYVLVLSDMG